MQSKSVSNEILDFFEHSLAAPAKSSFTQQHFKLQPEGRSFLFHIFVEQCRELSDQPYHGYRLLACDGSDVNIARDPEDERTFIHESEKGYNAIHVNALYDIMNHTYCDFLVRRHTKETFGNPDIYTIIQPATDFDFLNENCTCYDIEFRIVCILLDNGTYICIAINLPEEEFSLDEIKKLYHLRWNEETSFREFL